MPARAGGTPSDMSNATTLSGEHRLAGGGNAKTSSSHFFAITHLPKQPDYLRGVLNLHDAMIALIDLPSRLFVNSMSEAT
jgi:hypothetical protein